MMATTSTTAMGCTCLRIHVGMGVSGRRSVIRRTNSNEVDPEPRMIAARSTVASTELSRNVSSTCRRERR